MIHCRYLNPKASVMKKDIHPENHPAIFLDTSCGAEFVANSTLTSDETREINGQKYFVHRLEISSASHPFYTGKQILLDVARRAEKFQERAGKQTAAASLRKGKKVKRAKTQVTKVAKRAAKKKTETPETTTTSAA